MQYANETRASNEWAYSISATTKAKTKTIASNHLSTPAMRTFVGRNTTASNWMAVSVTLTLLLPPSLLNNSRVSFLFTSFFCCGAFFPRFVLFVRSFASLIFFFIRQLDYLPCSCAFDADLRCERGTTVQLYALTLFFRMLSIVSWCSARVFAICIHFPTEYCNVTLSSWQINFFLCITRIRGRDNSQLCDLWLSNLSNHTVSFACKMWWIWFFVQVWLFALIKYWNDRLLSWQFTVILKIATSQMPAPR